MSAMDFRPAGSQGFANATAATGSRPRPESGRHGRGRGRGGGRAGRWESGPASSHVARVFTSSASLPSSQTHRSQAPGQPPAKPALDFSPPACAALLPPVVRSGVDAYIARMGPLLEAELAEEQRVVRERLAAWPLARLNAEGLVLLGLTARRDGDYFGKVVLCLFTPGSDLPYHRFASGDLVTLCRSNPLSERTFEALVLEKTWREVRVVADFPPPNMSVGVWRLDKGANMTTYLRSAAAMRSLYKPVKPASQHAGQGQGLGNNASGQFAAVQSSQRDERDRDSKRGRRGQSGKAHRRGHNGEVEDEDEDDGELPTGTPLRPLLLAATPLEASDAWSPSLILPNVRFQTNSRAASDDARNPGPDSGPGSGLDASQAAAVELALRHRLSLVQGPPGTGKTSTIVQYLAWLKRTHGLKVPVLACAMSNVAVDNLLEGLVDAGVHAVRVGQPVKVREALRGATLDARLLGHPLQADIAQAAAEQREHRRRLPSMRGRDRGLGHRDAALMAKRLRALRHEMMEEVLQGADVICATCVGAGSEQLADLSFPLVVLDEGSQCAEPQALIPLTKGCVHAVLVGDHFQLPPTILSPDAAALSLSLFERLMRLQVPAALLQVQYRMHPALASFPSAHFYGGRVRDGVTALQRPAPPGLRWPSPLQPIMFLNVHGQESSGEGNSKANSMEAALVVRVVAALLAAGMAAVDIGVVTPYTAQVQLITRMLQRMPPNPSVLQGGGCGVTSDARGVEVKSVDGFQGREMEAVVFSCVRANAQGQVGFLDDWRRLNVAITRARRGLIIVGNTATLMTDPHWAALITNLQERGLVTDARAVGLNA
ncbi:P-loop containing nucleoside triphosphate hydrolase protein [Haematococcus lacustris]